jgi:serine/threonine-protein phosphatase 2A activator
MEPPPPPTTTTSEPTPNPSLPRLAVLTPSKSHPFQPPTKRIHTGADLPRFLSSLAYRDIGLFILQLNRALCPRKPTTPASKIQSFPLDAPRSDPPAIQGLRDLLTNVEGIIGEAPPEEGPRRFGNVSFRRWHDIVQQRVRGLLRKYLPRRMLEEWAPEEGVLGEDVVLAEVEGYFMGSWGSKERLDYGTGHELSFLAFLGCLWKLGAFGEEENGGEVERSLVLGVFEP